ncbi:MAG TPA: TetR/AcrR family transcriptional regulator [Deltaproteobacteria bacterium]|jgi:AcrR family transcriptional regulator|nr:TetR/AcrR family transcriptional regulator [Deltaproteobacteria bacterium]HOI06552.1 TetR/AcrR family transcriptional regulator [Deltaproteobacteria bacterium]
METRKRLSFDQRQRLIVERVREVFAHKGLEGVTTKELARVAGVSEGLLYKHFPTKQALFQAMLDSIEKDLPDEIHEIMKLEPSTETLVAIVHALATMFLFEHSDGMDDVTRMYLRSLAGDGEFARVLLKRPYEVLIPKLEECIRAAIASGDVVDSPVAHSLRAWFTERLAFMLMAEHLPAAPIMEYSVSRDRLACSAVWFLLRGMGLKEEAIRRCYPAGARSLHEE